MYLTTINNKMSTNQRILTEEEVIENFGTPDQLYYHYGKKSHTIVYLKSGELFFEKYPTTHTGLVYNYNIGSYFNLDSENKAATLNAIKDRVLLGRSTDISAYEYVFNDNLVKKVASFWNSTSLPELLSSCVREMVKDKLIDSDSLVITPAGGVARKGMAIKYANEIISGTTIKPVNKQQATEFNRLQQIHLLKGTEKKDKLLSIGARPRISPWKDVFGPGIKHWSLTGENYLNFKEFMLKQ